MGLCVVFDLPVWGLAGAVLVALVVDHFWGEPPARCHPVVWMGHALAALGRRVAPLAGRATPAPGLACTAPSAKNFKVFCLAALSWYALCALVFVISAGLQWLSVVGPVWLHAVVGAAAWSIPLPTALGQRIAGLHTAVPTVLCAVLLGLLLKPLFALRMLCDEVLAVEAALGQSLAAGRERLSWLVSRDVAQLTDGEVRESAIETLAENLNDSVVAPLFWFAVAGLPGAAIYRMANTADAMWGYPGERNGHNWAWAGKWAARADDALSWLPARLTAGLLVCVAWPLPPVRWQHLPREARRTPSPNSGWPMAAMALALGVRLGKPGAYVLNAAGQVPTGFEVFQAIKYAKKVALSLVFIALLAIICVVFSAIFTMN